MNKWIFIAIIIFLATVGCGHTVVEPQPKTIIATETVTTAVPQSEPEPTPLPVETPAPFDFIQYPAISVGMEGFISATDAVAATIAEELGIHLIPVNISENETEMLASMEKSGTLPDILRVDITASYFIPWVERGVLRTSWQLSELKDEPLLCELLENSDELKAMSKLYGGKHWFLPMQTQRKADSGRIYLRRDWLNELGIPAPDTLPEYLTMLETFTKNNKPGLAAAGGITFLISLFGADPESWVWEEGEWIPAYYSHRMIRGLQFARRLYEGQLIDREYNITKANVAIQKFADSKAGSLVRQGDGYWLSRVMSGFAEANGIAVQEAWNNHVNIIPPPSVPYYNEANAEIAEWKRYWPRAVERRGVVVPASVNDEQFERICRLLSYIASEESQEMAYFGIRGETCLPDRSGQMRLLVDPATARPYEITRKYPAAQVLFLLGRSPMSEQYDYIPSELPPNVKQAGADAAAIYDSAAIDEGDGFLARFICTPEKDALAHAVDYNGAFNRIVMGTDPVDAMFERFREDCKQKNIRVVINDVNAQIKGTNH